MPIPHRIIQTAKSRDLPPLARAAATNLKLLHPDWEYLFFDDEAVERFIASECPARYREQFFAFPRKIQRFDFFRYLAVHRFGGFYFDLDVFLFESLERLTPFQCVFPFEELTLNGYLRRTCHIDWELGNYAFGASAGNPFLGQLIENCVRAQQEPDWARPLMEGIPAFFRQDFNVLHTTGPGMVTRTFAESPQSAEDVHVLFPDDVCQEAGWHRFGSFGVHLMEASWREQKNPFIRRLALYWESRRRARLLGESRKLGPSRSFAPVAV